MAAQRKYPQELRERALRLVEEARKEDPELSLNAAVIWIGQRPGTTTDDAKKIKDLEAEVRELKRANEILLAASSFFARELDPRGPW